MNSIVVTITLFNGLFKRRYNYNLTTEKMETKTSRQQAIDDLSNWIANLPIGVVYKAEGKALLNALLESTPPGWQITSKLETRGWNIMKSP